MISYVHEYVIYGLEVCYIIIYVRHTSLHI